MNRKGRGEGEEEGGKRGKGRKGEKGLNGSK
jgi:hypothetical protein